MTHGRIYHKNIDDHLMPDAIESRFCDIDDRVIASDEQTECNEQIARDNAYNASFGINAKQSIIKPDEVNFSITTNVWAENMVKIIETLRERHNNVLIVGHSGTLVGLLPYLANHSMHGIEKHVCGDYNTGVLAVCNHNNISVYKNGKKTANCMVHKI
jgi:hypothetical protein